MVGSGSNRIPCMVALVMVCLPALRGVAGQDNRARLPRLVLNEVYVDYGVAVDPPLVKTKFNLYDAVIPSMEQFVEAVQIMGELNVETYRIELAWGRFSGYGLNTMITGTSETMVYDFAALDRIVTELKKRNVLLHGAYGYCPYPLQNASADAAAPAGRRGRRSRAGSAAPNDMGKWKEICATVAQHYLDMGIRMGVNEIWNEPDGLMSFFSGTEQEYQQMYKAAVEGIRAADPDAFVAGPASAPELVWHRSFPEYVAREKLPIDAFTFHHYGSGELGLNVIDKVKASLDRFDHFKTVDMVMDEWHSADLIEPWCRDDDVRATYEGASQLLHDFDVWLSRPELTAVSWAWYLDPARSRATCMGLITGDGHRKAVFNAWKIYGRMPVDRKEVRMIGPLRAMASADKHNAAVVLWNPDPYQRRVDVHLSNLPFSKGNAWVYRIDKEHASYGDGAPENLGAEESFEQVDLGAHWAWLDHIIPAHGTI
jgi:xylan 1,4-beta-xylosidase